NIMSHENIKIILITQSSSSNNINFCILEKDMYKSECIFKKEFQLELKEKIINPINIIKKLSIISVIGSNIYKKNNIASKIFSVLGMCKINVCAIAQGS
ncbi:bifunctional aspartate kinase/homoserine dehydrogenase I, partial [Buchnera aphidicola]|nr:bifunctional aspartate kinase/homoserine dehydrogenase I [Buchnera aphidicola]